MPNTLKRERFVGFRCRADEFAIIEAAAINDHRSLSGWIRNCLRSAIMNENNHAHAHRNEEDKAATRVRNARRRG